jgi:hypothetical protein
LLNQAPTQIGKHIRGSNRLRAILLAAQHQQLP